MTTSTTTACRPTVVQIERASASVRLVVTEGEFAGEHRVVSSPATAASLVSSWTSGALSGLSWAMPEPVKPTEPIREMAADAAPVAVAVEPPAVVIDVEAEPVVKTRTSWWLGVIGGVGEASTLGGGLSGALEFGDRRFRYGPVLRARWDRQTLSDEFSGAQNFEVGTGGAASFVVYDGAVRVMPRIALLPTYRLVTPNAPVGPIPCSPSRPCSVDDPLPPNADAFHALTVWTEASLDADVELLDGVASGIGLAFAATPGHVRVGAPAVPGPADPRDRIRDLPKTPRWRVSLQIGIRWW